MDMMRQRMKRRDVMGFILIKYLDRLEIRYIVSFFV